jgi:hypothetical protein
MTDRRDLVPGWESDHCVKPGYAFGRHPRWFRGGSPKIGPRPALQVDSTPLCLMRKKNLRVAIVFTRGSFLPPLSSSRLVPSCRLVPETLSRSLSAPSSAFPHALSSHPSSSPVPLQPSFPLQSVCSHSSVLQLLLSFTATSSRCLSRYFQPPRDARRFLARLVS